VLRPLLCGGVPDIRDSWGAAGGAAERGSLARLGADGPCVNNIVRGAESGPQHPLFSDAALVLNRRDPESGSCPSDHVGVAVTVQLP
jgi:hypothetical protein